MAAAVRPLAYAQGLFNQGLQFIKNGFRDPLSILKPSMEVVAPSLSRPLAQMKAVCLSRAEGRKVLAELNRGAHEVVCQNPLARKISDEIVVYNPLFNRPQASSLNPAINGCIGRASGKLLATQLECLRA
jgi:hypothetical protein